MSFQIDLEIVHVGNLLNVGVTRPFERTDFKKNKTKNKLKLLYKMKCKQRVVCFYNEKINGKSFLLLYFLFFSFEY